MFDIGSSSVLYCVAIGVFCAILCVQMPLVNYNVCVVYYIVRSIHWFVLCIISCVPLVCVLLCAPLAGVL